MRMSVRAAVRGAVIGLLVGGLVVFVLSCQPKSEPEPQATSDSLRMEELAVGQQAYLAYCAMCHGEWGTGDGPLAEEMLAEAGIKPSRLNDRARLAEMGRDELIQVIKRGGGHTGRSNLMPPWGETVDSKLIEEVADFVQALPDLKPGTPDQTIEAFLAAPPGAPAEGRRQFVFYCTICHGAQGRGDGYMADTLWARNQIRPRDLTDTKYFESRSDQDLYVAIALGGAHSGKSLYMPAWSYTFTPDEINNLIAYVRAISGTTAQP